MSDLPIKPKTIAIPRKSDVRAVSKIKASKKHTIYRVTEFNRSNRTNFYRIWHNDSYYLRPVYIKYQELWWRVFAVDKETNEAIVVLEDGSEIPPDPIPEVTKLIVGVLEHNKMKAMFHMYRDTD